MQSDDLTADQIEALKSRLVPVIQYLQALQARMTAQHFPWQDRLRLRALIALDALEAMHDVLEHLAKERVTRDTYMLGVKPRDWKRQQRDKRN